MPRSLFALLAFVLALIAPAERAAFAADPPGGKAIAVYVEGSGLEGVRAAVVAALAGRFRLIDPGTFTAALTREGARLPIGPSLTKGAGRRNAISSLRNAATASGADAVVVGRILQINRRPFVTLLWIDPRSPEPVLDKDVALAGESDGDAVAGALGPTLDSFAAAAAPAGPASRVPSPDSIGPALVPPGAAPAEARPVDERRPHEPSTAIVVATLAFDLGGRRFEYSDGITRNLPDYKVLGVPLPSIALELYPAAGTRVPFLRDLGLTFHFSDAFELGSRTSTGATVSTGWTRLGGGLRARFRPGGVRGPMIGLQGGVEYLSFTFGGDAHVTKVAPSVKYLALRGGIDVRIPFWRMALLLGGGYDGPLSAGDVHDRFRDPSLGGIDAGAGLAFVLGAGFELRLHGDYTRYFYKFRPVPGDPYVAGGALDELVAFGVGVAYAY